MHSKECGSNFPYKWYFGDENLQVYTSYISNPKVDKGSFMHGKMSLVPPVNPIVIAMMFIL
jgi:hypothetical protein